MAIPKLFRTVPRFAALASLLVTVVGFIVIVAGLSKIQSTTNHLGVVSNDQTVYPQYVTTYTSSLITPYPDNHHMQFAYIWFIIFGNLFTVLFCAAVILVPFLHTGRLAAMAFLAILTTLTITVVNNLVFLHKNAVANTVYKPLHLKVTLAGALLVVLGNVFTILTLGFFEPLAGRETHHYPITNTKNPIVQTQGLQSATTVV